MQEVGWKGIELRDAAQEFKLTTYNIIVCLQASSNIFTHFITGGTLSVTYLYLD